MVDAYPVDLGGIVPYSQCRLNHVRHFGFVFVNATGFVYCSVVCSRCCVLLFYPAHAVRFIDVRGSYVPHCKGYFRRQVFLWCATFSVFPLDGVSFPGHFLVKLEIDDGAIVLDPYFGGISLTEDDLEDRIQEYYGEQLKRHHYQGLLATSSKKISSSESCVICVTYTWKKNNGRKLSPWPIPWLASIPTKPTP